MLKFMIEKIITEDELNDVFSNTDFGGALKRDVVKYALLKVACGYANGKTTHGIILDLGLVNEKNRLTKKGKEYLWECYKNW